MGDKDKSMFGGPAVTSTPEKCRKYETGQKPKKSQNHSQSRQSDFESSGKLSPIPVCEKNHESQRGTSESDNSSYHSFDINPEINSSHNDSDPELIKRFEKCSLKERSNNAANTKNGYINFNTDDDLDCNSLDLSQEELEGKKLIILNNITVSMKDIIKIERNTIGQSSNVSWKKERQYRLTASNFGRICTLKPTTPRENALKNLLYGKKLITFAMKYGIENEIKAKVDFEKKFNLSCNPCGLFVDEKLHFLAASPDGIINDDGILEIKCPYSIKTTTPQDAAINKTLKYLKVNNEGGIELRRTHHYYYQIQGQLHITKREYCYFVVWTPEGLFAEKIFKDDVYWNDKMEEQLKAFYMDYMLPEFVNPKIDIKTKSVQKKK